MQLQLVRYVEVMYKAIMNREPDADGINVWKECLANGVSRTFVLNGFMQSQEFQDICNEFGIEKGSIELTENRDKNYNVTSFVQRFYTKTLERAAEVEGMNVWAGAILDKKITPAEAAKVFVFSSEANNMNRNNESFIKMMYRTFMGRECEDDTSLNIWLDYLESNTREAMFGLFADSKEFTNIVKGYGL